MDPETASQQSFWRQEAPILCINILSLGVVLQTLIESNSSLSACVTEGVHKLLNKRRKRKESIDIKLSVEKTSQLQEPLLEEIKISNNAPRENSDFAFYRISPPKMRPKTVIFSIEP